METEGTTIVKESPVKLSNETIPGRVYSYGCLLKAAKGFALDLNESNLVDYLEYTDEEELWKYNRKQVVLDLEQKRYLDKK